MWGGAGMSIKAASVCCYTRSSPIFESFVGLLEGVEVCGEVTEKDVCFSNGWDSVPWQGTWGGGGARGTERVRLVPPPC